MDKMLKAGAGVSKLIFPDHYFPSDGFAGIHDPMRCKALLLEQNGVRGGIITLELPSVRPWELTEELRAFAARELQVPADNLWLVMTHDLSAPHVPPDEPKRTLHMNMLYSAIREAAAKAASEMTPVSVSFAEASCGINVNRDLESRDGWWVGIGGAGPSDHTLSLLRFDREDGQPAAVLYSYAIKSSVLETVTMPDGKRYASGDVTGEAGAKAEAALHCPVLFVMGAAGDQVPRQKGSHLVLDSEKRFVSVNHGEAAYEMLDKLSDELAESILIASDRSRGQTFTPRLSFLHDAVSCPAKKPYPKTLPPPPVQRYVYENDGEQVLEIWMISFGEIVIIGVRPEIPTPIFASLRKRASSPKLMLATLVNGGQGYIATDTDLARFTYPGLNSPFRSGADELFVQTAASMLQDPDTGGLSAKRKC